MSVVVNEVRRGAYLDSIALMRFASAVRALAGVEECGIMMGTPANLRILAEAGVLAAGGRAASPGDLVVAIRAADAAAAERALATARGLLDRPAAHPAEAAGRPAPRSLATATSMLPGANLALVSVPGAFAAAEARKALALGLNVMLFSDNVAIEDECALKRDAVAQGLLMMGPDCGTAIIAGTPLGFANAVARGPVGIIAASGTGLQEIACLIDAAGSGISHAIGVGGRDLKAEVGGLMTLLAFDLLDADPATRHIVLVSKPPAPGVARRMAERIARSQKPVTACLIGATETALPANARLARTLEDAALLAVGREPVLAPRSPTAAAGHGGLIHGLFAGGTLCAEAQVILRDAGLRAASNVPIPGVPLLADAGAAHPLVDLGDDAFTLGRPHPMLEPSVRDAPLAAALADPSCRVVLLDCVLGHGCHPDPAGHLASRLRGRPTAGPPIVVSVTGTERDPQRRSAQVAALAEVGAQVAPSNAAAVRRAVELWARGHG